MQRRNGLSLWESLDWARSDGGGWLWTPESSVALSDLAVGSSLGVRVDALRGRTVLVWTTEQLPAALALIEIDGIVRRLVVCPPDFDPVHLPYVIATAEVDLVITDRRPNELAGVGVAVASCGGFIRRSAIERAPDRQTEWILFTSGTTGVPKMVVHTLSTLTGA